MVFWGSFSNVNSLIVNIKDSRPHFRKKGLKNRKIREKNLRNPFLLNLPDRKNLRRVNPGRNIFSINVELTSTFFTLQRFGPSSSPNFKPKKHFQVFKWGKFFFGWFFFGFFFLLTRSFLPLPGVRFTRTVICTIRIHVASLFSGVHFL